MMSVNYLEIIYSGQQLAMGRRIDEIDWLCVDNWGIGRILGLNILCSLLIYMFEIFYYKIFFITHKIRTKEILFTC